MERKTMNELLRVSLLFFIVATVDAVQIYRPETIVAALGESKSMSCGSDSREYTIHWYFFATEATEEILIFNGKFTEPGIEVVFTEPGIYSIRIENVTSANSGTYRCLVRKSEIGGTKTVEEIKADLIVIGSQPLCGINGTGDRAEFVEGDSLILFCSVECFGNWIPVMKWSRADSKYISNEVTFRNGTKSKSTVDFVLTADDNGAMVLFNMAFQTPKANIRMRTYEFHWNYTVNVYYLVKGIGVVPEAETFSSGDILDCTADGNPNPKYIWKSNDESIVVHNKCLTIGPNMSLGHRYTFNCTAENTIKNKSSIVSFTITFLYIENHALLFVVIGLAIICLHLSLILIYIGRKEMKSIFSFCCVHLCQHNMILEEINEPNILLDFQDENLALEGNNAGERLSSSRFCGADGTEYMEMNAFPCRYSDI